MDSQKRAYTITLSLFKEIPTKRSLVYLAESWAMIIIVKSIEAED